MTLKYFIQVRRVQRKLKRIKWYREGYIGKNEYAGHFVNSLVFDYVGHLRIISHFYFFVFIFLTLGLKELADYLPASLASIISYFSAEVTRGVWKPAFMNGTDWPSPAANLSMVEEQIKNIVAATGVDVPSLVAGTCKDCILQYNCAPMYFWLNVCAWILRCLIDYYWK